MGAANRLPCNPHFTGCVNEILLHADTFYLTRFVAKHLLFVHGEMESILSVDAIRDTKMCILLQPELQFHSVITRTTQRDDGRSKVIVVHRSSTSSSERRTRRDESAAAGRAARDQHTQYQWDDERGGECGTKFVCKRLLLLCCAARLTFRSSDPAEARERVSWEFVSIQCYFVQSFF